MNSEGDFVCKNCDREVDGHAMGVRNRNHCPYCLWSLHVDIEDGDRKNPCRGKMMPAGLRFKEVKINKYKPDQLGEMMIEHKCTVCGEMSYCRVAGDDDEGKLEDLAQVLVGREKEEAMKQLGK